MSADGFNWKGDKIYYGDTEIKKDSTSTSNKNIQPGSVLSAFESRSQKPNPTSTASWSSANEPSRERSRYTTGFPNTFFGGASQGSDPVYGADRKDPYRDAMTQKPGNHGPPRTSDFSRTYNHYKNLDAAGTSSKDDTHSQHVQTARQPTQEMAKNNPGL